MDDSSSWTGTGALTALSGRKQRKSVNNLPAVADSYGKAETFAKTALKHDMAAMQLYSSSKPDLKRESFKRAHRASKEYLRGK